MIGSKAQDRELRKLRKYLTELTIAVSNHLSALDKEMRQPSDAARGKRIAALSNNLEMANDSARYFGLGIDYRTDRKSA